jgi:5'(3')-deoxyribonucleotidase
MKSALVAMELRKLADALDAQPDAEIISPWISFYGSEKDKFLATARLLPRPLKKHVHDEGKSYSRVKVECTNFQAIDVNASIPQSLTCEIVAPAKPAVYRCEPILSEEEDAEMVA